MAMNITAIIMTDTAALLRLMSWLSPVFPTGGFAYSAGLEQAVADDLVGNTDDLLEWVATQLAHGSLWNDAVFFAGAHRCGAKGELLEEVTALALAMVTARQRLAETKEQGTSFLKATAHWINAEKLPPRETPLPLAVGYSAGLEAIPLEQALSAYLHAFASSQLQCAIRLSVTGQEGAAKVLAALEPVVVTTAAKAATSTLEDLGTSAFLADIAAMRHETLEPRLFKS